MREQIEIELNNCLDRIYTIENKIDEISKQDNVTLFDRLNQIKLVKELESEISSYSFLYEIYSQHLKDIGEIHPAMPQYTLYE